uniref:C-type lectin domain-containing protein n=1 Tax=Fundulus heteroclitus TaxID=8078 RepID=A0A3Q2P6L1_FUNHE
MSVCAKCAADVQQAGQSTRSKGTSERVVLLVLIAILVAVIIALAVSEFVYFIYNIVLYTIFKLETQISKNREITSCCLQITQTSTEMSSSGSFCSDLFKDETCQKCEAGWELHGGNCYKFSTMKSSWNESRDSCKDLGGDLVKIDSREEQDNLKDKFWIGLTDSKEEGRWLWVDGSPLDESLTFWAGNQPDNKSKDEKMALPGVMKISLVTFNYAVSVL